MGDRHFKTIFGSFMTITVYTLILINSITIGLAYLNNENQIEINRVISQEPESLGPMNFYDNGLDIAIFHSIPPEIGHLRISKTWIDFDQFNPETGYILEEAIETSSCEHFMDRFYLRFDE